MRRIVALASLVFSPLLAIDLDGNYLVTGYDPYYEQTYTGIARIVKNKGNIYNMEWTFDQEHSLYESYGIGILMDNVLSVVFRNLPNNNAPNFGLQTYQIVEDSLEGTYVLLGRNLLGKEKLQKQ